MSFKTSYSYLLFLIIETNLFAQNPDYFPLQIGNKWIFDRCDIEGYDICEIIDTVRIDNKLYYNFQYKYADSDLIHNSLYYYKDNDNIVWAMYGQYPEQAYAIYKFNIEPGENWFITQYFDMIATLESKTEIINTRFQEFHNCYYFTFHFLQLYEIVGNYFAPEIGLVQKSEDNLVHAKLKGAFLNGVIFGDTTTSETSIVNIESRNSNSFFIQNYPNPFNNQTRIKYHLYASSNVKIVIYNQQGQIIKNLEDVYKQQGNHEIIWDCSNSRGNQIASGIYFLKIYMANSSETQKLLLIR